jgi:hypothetical protein
MNAEPNNPALALRHMSERDFALLGTQNVAYIKLLDVNGAPGWAIFGADGSQIGMAADRDVAFAAVRQHDLEPVSVH